MEAAISLLLCLVISYHCEGHSFLEHIRILEGWREGVWEHLNLKFFQCQDLYRTFKSVKSCVGSLGVFFFPNNLKTCILSKKLLMQIRRALEFTTYFNLVVDTIHVVKCDS